MQNILVQSKQKKNQSLLGKMGRKVAAQRKPCSEETKIKISIANSRPKIHKKCILCWEGFDVIQSRDLKAKFCSKKCQLKALTSKDPWNKGKKGLQEAWNKGIKMPQITGKNHPLWNGGRYKQANGYIFLYSPNHPNKNTDGYVLEHRVIMENKIGRLLKREEVVHHINHKPADNRIQNLKLCRNNREHRRIHAGYKKIDNRWYKSCYLCNKLLLVNKKNFVICNGTASAKCREHLNIYQNKRRMKLKSRPILS